MSPSKCWEDQTPLERAKTMRANIHDVFTMDDCVLNPCERTVLDWLIETAENHEREVKTLQSKLRKSGQAAQEWKKERSDMREAMATAMIALGDAACFTSVDFPELSFEQRQKLEKKLRDIRQGLMDGMKIGA